MLPFLLALYAGMLGQASAPLQPRIESEIANHLSYMEGALGDKNYFTGDDLMAADIQLSYVLEVADISKRLEPYPNLQKLIARMRARPGRERFVTDLAANVSKLSGTHVVGVRLELVTV